MFELKNHTPYAAELGVYTDHESHQHVLLTFKASFEIPTKMGQPLRQIDVPIYIEPQLNDPENESSLKYDTEMGAANPGTDVAVLAQAWNPKGAPFVDSGIQIAGRPHVARVYGERRWQRSISGMSVSQPLPFESSPLQFEEAFGGWDKRHEDSQFHGYEARNPVGRGYFAPRSPGPGEGELLPSIESSAQAIRSWRDAIEPIGFGFVAPHWQSRRDYAGTYDDDWQKTRNPLLPHDFDPRFYHSAVPQLCFEQPFQGGETVQLWNLKPFEYTEFKLPRWQVAVEFLIAEQCKSAVPKLDCVVVEPGENRFSLLFKASQPCTRMMHRVRRVNVEGSFEP